MAFLRTLDLRRLANIAVVVLLAYLVLGPLIVLVFSSFKETQGSLPFESTSAWTLENYRHVFLNPTTYELLFNTLVVAIGALIVAFTLSLALAWLVERTDVPARNLLFVMVVASLGIPGFIAAIGWSLLLNPSNGLLNIPLRDLLGLDGDGPLNIFTMPGLIFLEGLRLVPVTFLLLAAAFRAMDATLEDAGAASGASFRTTTRRITLPLLTPAILSALIYQFVTVIESFDVPLIIGLRGGIPLLSTQIFLEVRPPIGLPDYGTASGYGILLLALVVVPLLYYNSIVSRADRYATISGHSYQPRRVILGRWRFLALALVGLYLLLDFVLPAAVMIWISIQPFYALPSPEAFARISFDAYLALPGSEIFQEALVNTLFMGFVAAFLTMSLALFVSWIIVRSRSRFRVPLDILAFMPHAFPAVVIGLSLLLIYLALPLPIYATIWIIIIAVGTRYISIATRQMNTGIGQVQRELEEAAETSGASWPQTVRRVLLPLVLPAFLNGFLLVMLLGIKQLVLPLMLTSHGNVVLSTLIWVRWDNADYPATGALGTIMVLLTLALAVGLRRFSHIGAPAA